MSNNAYGAARYSASVNTREGVDPFWMSSAIAFYQHRSPWQLCKRRLRNWTPNKLREVSPRRFGSKLLQDWSKARCSDMRFRFARFRCVRDV
jgi:hypothetical protein